MTRFFCPGRTELAGNHTDHQKGRVLAAAVEAGITGEAEPNGEDVIRVFSEGFEPVEVNFDRLWPEEREAGSSTAMVRGMAGILADNGQKLRGFDAYLSSALPSGGGMSSSAAFCVLTGFMMATFSEGAPVPPEELARIAQKAENRWYGKPCGLMDQMTCAMGGGVYMDFLDNKLLHIDCNFDKLGLALCLTETGGSHAKAVAEYAAIPADMAEVAAAFGESFLANVRASDFDALWPAHQTDPKWMRARHFFDETWRVSAMADALGLADGARYMELMNQSGRSSEQLLKNIESPAVGSELAQGLEASARLLRGKGAWRVHGGGFTGCVQALMPEAEFPDYQAAMDALFGHESCRRIRICERGVSVVDDTFPKQKGLN